MTTIQLGFYLFYVAMIILGIYNFHRTIKKWRLKKQNGKKV